MSDSKGRVLVVEDDATSAFVVRRRLEAEGFSVFEATDGLKGLAVAREEKPDVIITDWMMPHLDGPGMCQKLREDQELADCYVIMLSARTERSERIFGLEAGADDYLGKDSDHDELIARVQAGFRIRRRQEELARRADRDPLTGLLNTEAFRRNLESEIERARRFKNSLTLVMIDLDKFKEVNDGAGHLAGDEAIRHAANLLTEHSRAQDLLGRVGGDEFSLAFVEANAATAAQVMDRVRSILGDEPFHYEDQLCAFGLSYGLAELDPDRLESAEDLIRRADEGLYAMKAESHGEVTRPRF